MTRLPEAFGDAEEGRDLRTRARINEIGRRTSALRFRLGFLRWLVIPVLGLALVAMVAGLVLGLGAARELIAGIVGVAGATAGFIHWVGRLQDEVFDLEEEKASVTRNLPGTVEEGGSLIDSSS